MSTSATRRRRPYSKPFLVTVNTAAPRIVVSHQLGERNGTESRAASRRDSHHRRDEGIPALAHDPRSAQWGWGGYRQT